MAAVGRKNWRIDRPAVTLRASVAPTTRSPVRTRTLSRCQSVGRNRHSQPSSRTTIRTASRNQPKKLATSGLEVLSPSALIFSMASVVIRSPRRTTIFSPWRIETMTGWTAARALAFSWSVSSWLNEELATTSGPISCAASARSLSSRPPAMSPASRVRVSGTSLSSSGARSSASRIRADSVRTTDQRPASIARRVAWAASVRPGTAAWSRPARWSGVISAENAVSTRGDALLERDLLLVGERDGLLGGEVVDGRHVLDGRVAARPRSGCRWGTRACVGDDDVARREVADRRGEASAAAGSRTRGSR